MIKSVNCFQECIETKEKERNKEPFAVFFKKIVRKAFLSRNFIKQNITNSDKCIVFFQNMWYNFYGYGLINEYLISHNSRYVAVGLGVFALRFFSFI